MEHLDLHLKVLVLEHGRTRVVQSLARISGVSEASVEDELLFASKNQTVKASKKVPTSAELLEKMDLPVAKRESLGTLAKEFENKRFLGEMRLVLKFLREHQVGVAPKSRLRALPKVLSILADLPQNKLEELIADCTIDTERSGYSHLAGAIMGQK